MNASKPAGRLRLWVLIGILAVTGITMAIVLSFGSTDSIAFGLVWRLFVADLYLLASLAARHDWLRWTVWIGAGVTFVLGILAQWSPITTWLTDEAAAHPQPGVYEGDPSTGWAPWAWIEGDLESGAHAIMATLAVLCILSLAYDHIRSVTFLRITYVIAYIAGLAGALATVFDRIDQPYRWNIEGGTDFFYRSLSALFVIAATAAVIVVIGSFMQKRTGGPAGPPAVTIPGSIPAGVSDEEIRARVRQYVDEYLRERGL